MLAVSLGTLSIAMAVLGGVIATEKRIVRLSFVAMGLLSLAFVAFQAVRATKEQDALAKEVAKVDGQAVDLTKAQIELAKAQAELNGLSTGGDSFPSVHPMFYVPEDGARYVTFEIVNRSSTRPLYSISGRVVHSQGNVVFLDRDKNGDVMGEFVFSEITPTEIVEIPGLWKVNGPDDIYDIHITARNGQFLATFARKDSKWQCTVKRKNSSVVLEQTEKSE